MYDLTSTGISSILTQFLTQLADEIKARAPKASGKLADSIQVKVTSGQGKLKGIIEADKYIYTLEHGRGPTKNTAKGSPTLRENILEWIKTRGFSFPITSTTSKGFAYTIKNAESLSWAISIKIHNEGNALFRRGGHSGVLSNVINDQRIDAFVKVFHEKGARIILDNILKGIKT